MSKVIVSTTPDGGVWVTYPAPEIMTILTFGGAPEGYFGRIDWDDQIARHTASGLRESVAVKWVNSLRCGGLTTAEAHELVSDKVIPPEWTAKELWDWEDIPSDRWFRDAWHRSHNGGPIGISLKKARPVQFGHICSAIDQESKRRKIDIDLFDIPIECDLPMMRERIYRAADEMELRSIWPESI